MAYGRTRRSNSNGKRANGSVKLGVKDSVSASKKASKAVRNTTGKNRKVKESNSSKGKKSQVAVAVVFWTVLILATLLYITYKLTIKPPVITPIPTPTSTPKVDGRENSEDIENTQDPTNTTEPSSEAPTLSRKEKFYTFLVIGKDKVGKNTDVLMVGSYDAKNLQANIVSIPRDTIVNVSRKVKKINAAYAYGGIENLKEEVSLLIGFKPDFYILVELDGFVTLVDAIGGVEFNIPIDMNYDDPNQGLSIHHKKGLKQLDGQAALEVVRFRQNNDGTGYPRQDLDRIQTSQNLIAAVVKKMVNLKTLLKITELVDIAKENLDTDLKAGEMLWLAKEALKIEVETGLHFYTYSDKTFMYKGLSYVYAEEDEALELINSTINPYTTDITNLDLIQP